MSDKYKHYMREDLEQLVENQFNEIVRLREEVKAQEKIIEIAKVKIEERQAVITKIYDVCYYFYGLDRGIDFPKETSDADT